MFAMIKKILRSMRIQINDRLTSHLRGLLKRDIENLPTPNTLCRDQQGSLLGFCLIYDGSRSRRMLSESRELFETGLTFLVLLTTLT